MPSKKKIPASGPSDTEAGGAPEPAVPPVDAITKLELFLEKHWRMVVALLALMVAVVVVFFYTKYKKEDATTEANNAFTSAITRTDLEDVLKDFPGTPAAGSALYAIADRLLAEAKLDEAKASLDKFVADFPNHKLRENALLGLGGISEKQGDLDKADGYFQQVIDAGDKTALVPLATICKTEILVAKGELEKAKEIYEAFGINFIGSPFVEKAEERLAAVEAKIKRKAAPEAPVEPEPELKLEPEKATPATTTPPVKEPEPAVAPEAESTEPATAPAGTEAVEPEAAPEVGTDAPEENSSEAAAPVEEGGE